ncbi:hypothetical protein [Pimelobacter simplex]|uniref:hypothetical protein n=1 Tax=Nocardioides simplex TaxID=2045 RepID=UPI003AB0C03A
MYNTLTADTILGAVETGAMLWPHNQQATEDIGVEMAVLAALGKPTDAPTGKALHRRAGAHFSQVRPLLVGLNRNNWTLRDMDEAPCDRCDRDVSCRHTLRVPAGATVVELHVCQRCREQLDGSLLDLVWS